MPPFLSSIQSIKLYLEITFGSAGFLHLGQDSRKNPHAGPCHLNLPSYSPSVRASWVVFWRAKSHGSLSRRGLSILPAMMAVGLCVFTKAYSTAHQHARILLHSITSVQKRKLNYRRSVVKAWVYRPTFPSDYTPHSTSSSNPSFRSPTALPCYKARHIVCLFDFALIIH